MEAPEDHEVVAILVREFGAPANTDIYGPLVAQVRDGFTRYGEGPQFVWTDLLMNQNRRLGKLK